jgi:putative nucleotidyltransferase with HDIG domain
MQFSTPSASELDEVVDLLGPKLFTLFQKMSFGEQAHCLRVMEYLRQENESNVDLLIAALLHDVGKTKYPLKLWERVWIVIGEALFPELTKTWGSDLNAGNGKYRRLQRPFFVSQQHASWGAEMASEAGASQMTAYLIANHENLNTTCEESRSGNKLRKLQIADQMN